MMNKIKKATLALVIGASLMGTVAPVVAQADKYYYDDFEVIFTDTVEHDEDGWDVIDWDRDIDDTEDIFEGIDEDDYEAAYRRAFANKWKREWGEEDFYRNFPDGVVYGEE